MTESQALDPEILPTEQSEADGEATKKGGFPSPLTILLLVLVGVWILGLVLPSGQYELNDAGAPIPGSFHEVPSPLDFRDSLSDLALSPGNGLFGVQDPTTGNVGPFNSGSLFGSAHVFLFILAIGGSSTAWRKKEGASDCLRLCCCSNRSRGSSSTPILPRRV